MVFAMEVRRILLNRGLLSQVKRFIFYLFICAHFPHPNKKAFGFMKFCL